MKHFNTRSLRRPDRTFVAFAAAALSLLLAACVTQGTYDEMTAERDALASSTRRLEDKLERMSVSIESLDSERAALVDELETLRIKRDQLDSAVRRLASSESRLAENLQAREEELAVRRQEIGRLRGTYQELVADLEAEVSSGQIEIQRLREGLRLNVAENILFPSGSTSLNQSGVAVLRKVARQLEKLGHRVEIQGHTDNVPIRATALSRYPTNWELAAARASVVVRLLATEGVDPTLLSAVSFGEFQPVASNESPEGRLRNRRIEIRLQPVESPQVPIEETESDSQQRAREEAASGATTHPPDRDPAATPAASPVPGPDAPPGS